MSMRSEFSSVMACNISQDNTAERIVNCIVLTNQIVKLDERTCSTLATPSQQTGIADI